jgi:8-oxo-dGTP pyrophosphatase MutT (NUDIX family)
VLRALRPASTVVTAGLLALFGNVTKSCNAGNLARMDREISAGGIVIQRRDGGCWVAAIELPSVSDRSADPPKPRLKRSKPVLALPKGLVDPGEKPVETALREVYEETGVTADVITKLGDIKYIYTRTWAGGERVFKIVSFYLMRYRAGRINDLAAEMRIEVARALWIELEEAPRLLAYSGEKQMVRKAMEYLVQHPDS